jgi:hypothetical protein
MIRLLAITMLAHAALVGPALAQDTVHYKDGRDEAGLVTEMTGGYLVLRPALPGQVIRRIDVGTVATARFGMRPEMEKALALQGIERLEMLRRVWYLLRPSIALPESPAGKWGLDFAEVILHSDLPDHVKLSFEVFQTIERNDWNRERRHAARRGRFNAMLNLGMMDEAMAEARRVAEDPSQEDPELLILARMMLGDLAFKQLRALEEDNPRWDIDDLVRPQRNALHDTAMDHYMFAHLYHGDRPEAAARGLWAAIQVMLHSGDKSAAAARAADLRALYPATHEAALAEPLAKQAPKPVESPDEETEPGVAGDAVAPAAAGSPSAPLADEAPAGDSHHDSNPVPPKKSSRQKKDTGPSKKSTRDKP